MDAHRPTGLPDAGTFRVSYDGMDGFWHDDPESPFMYREDGRTTTYRMEWLDYRPQTFRPLHSRQRRKRIETWREDGNPVGRWVWEYRSTP